MSQGYFWGYTFITVEMDFGSFNNHSIWARRTLMFVCTVDWGYMEEAGNLLPVILLSLTRPTWVIERHIILLSSPDKQIASRPSWPKSQKHTTVWAWYDQQNTFYLIKTLRQRRGNECHLGIAPLGHEPPAAVDDHPQPVHFETALAKLRLLDLVTGARLHGVHSQRRDGGLCLAWVAVQLGEGIQVLWNER